MLTLQISVDRSRVDRGRALLEKSRIVERGETLWDWLRHDERGRIVGLIAASIAMSLAMSLLATIVARAVEGRRTAAAPVPEAMPAVQTEATPDDLPAVDPSDPEVAPAEG